jgi:hypothetical protein
LASNSVQFQFRRYFFDSFTVGISYDVPVDFKSGSRIGVTELPLHDLGRGPGIEQQRRVRVAKCMKSTPRESERIQNDP